MRCRRILVAVLSLLAVGCGGKDGQSPTSPQEPSLLLDGVILLGMVPESINGVIREVHLLLDGEVGHRQTYSPPGTLFSFQFYDAPIKKGSHTLAVRVVNQSVVTQVYDLSGLLIVSARGAEKTILIPITKKELRAGESIEFKFDAIL